MDVKINQKKESLTTPALFKKLVVLTSNQRGRKWVFKNPKNHAEITFKWEGSKKPDKQEQIYRKVKDVFVRTFEG